MSRGRTRRVPIGKVRALRRSVNDSGFMNYDVNVAGFPSGFLLEGRGGTVGRLAFCSACRMSVGLDDNVFRRGKNQTRCVPIVRFPFFRSRPGVLPQGWELRLDTGIYKTRSLGKHSNMRKE